VLLVTIDQWRADCLSVAGHTVVQTPSLDALAASGVRFTNHYTQAAPCGPSRASLFTGLYLMNHRSVGNGTPLDARWPTLATLFRKAGYDPVLFGYTDTTVDPRTVSPDDPRLRSYEGVLPGFRVGVQLPTSAEPWLEWLRTKGVDAPESVWDLYARAGPGIPAPYPAECSEAAFLTEAALAEVRAATEPWFVHVAYLRPHPPWLAPPPWHDRYDPADVPAPVRRATREDEAAMHPLLAAVIDVPIARSPGGDEQRAITATYFGMLSEVDEQLGRLLAGVDELSGSDDTIVVVTSDHGEQLGDHWLVEKLLWFDSSYRIPLLIRAPGAPAGTVVDAFTESIDVAPTLLDRCGIEHPPHVDGASLAPFLDGTGEPPGWREEIRFEWDFRNPRRGAIEGAFGLRMDECSFAVVRDHDGKYVHFGGHARGVPPLFFDLRDDPGELVDRAADPARRGDVADYAQRMLTWHPKGFVSRRDPPRPGVASPGVDPIR
jgi:arylsulfatase A-like enzyme